MGGRLKYKVKIYEKSATIKNINKYNLKLNKKKLHQNC